MFLPLVAIVAADEAPAPLRRLLIELCALAVPVALDPAINDQLSACVAASSALVASAPRGRPLAVWADDGADAAALGADDRVHVVLSATTEAVEAAAAKGLFVPPEDRRLPSVHLVTPAVRARVRRAFGLQRQAIAVVDDDAGEYTWCGQPIRTTLVDAALACAAAAVVRGAVLYRALAWGCPIVTDDASRVTVGAIAGHDVVVATNDPQRDVEQLAADRQRATALSWHGRQCYEDRFDARRSAYALARRLNLCPSGPFAVRAVLAELGTPFDGAAAARAYDRLSPFVT